MRQTRAYPSLAGDSFFFWAAVNIGLFWDSFGDSSWLNKLAFGEDLRSGGTPHHVGEVRHSFALLVELEEGRQVDDVLLRQAQLLLEDVPVPVDAALDGIEKSRSRRGIQVGTVPRSISRRRRAKMQHLP